MAWALHCFIQLTIILLVLHRQPFNMAIKSHKNYSEYLLLQSTNSILELIGLQGKVCHTTNSKHWSFISGRNICFDKYLLVTWTLIRNIDKILFFSTNCIQIKYSSQLTNNSRKLGKHKLFHFQFSLLSSISLAF